MTSHDKGIALFRMHVGARLFLRNALTLLTAWAFAWGLAILVLRGAVGVPRLPLLWGAMGVPLALGIAIIMALRRLPSPVAVRAMLDDRSGCGGLLMTAEECELGNWRQTMPNVAIPRLRWRGGRLLGIFLAGSLFVLVSFLFPQRLVALASSRLDIEDDVEKLAAQLETLREEKIIESSRAEDLEKKLKQLREESSGEDPAKTLEALDHMEKVLSKEAKEAAEQALAQTERLTKAEMLAEALQEGAASLEPKLTADAMGELAEMMEKAIDEKDLVEKDLDAETAAGAKPEGSLTKEQLRELAKSLREAKKEVEKQLKEGKLTKEQLKEIAKALRQGKKEAKQRLQKMHDAGLIDLKTLKACDALGQCNAEGLADFLEENAGDASVAEMLDMFPGKGGVSRGRGDAAMTWTEGTSPDGAKFKEQILPHSDLKALKESQMAGVSKGAPQVQKATGPNQSGALKGSASGGGAANRQMLLPRHRGTVQRFFERNEK